MAARAFASSAGGNGWCGASSLRASGVPVSIEGGGSLHARMIALDGPKHLTLLSGWPREEQRVAGRPCYQITVRLEMMRDITRHQLGGGLLRLQLMLCDGALLALQRPAR